MNRLLQLCCVTAGFGLAVSCLEGGQVATTILPEYFTAVQNADLDRLFCLSSGAAEAEELGADPEARKEGFRDFARGELAAYLEQREEGFVQWSGHGIREVKLFVLGKGTFYSSEAGIPTADGRLQIRTLLRFGYSQMNLSQLSPGTTFYVTGAPIGAVTAIRVPGYSTEMSEQVLDSVMLEWTLTRQKPFGDCRNQWAVSSVTPVEGSETVTQVTWVF